MRMCINLNNQEFLIILFVHFQHKAFLSLINFLYVWSFFIRGPGDYFHSLNKAVHVHAWVHGKEGSGKLKRKMEISQLCKVNDHYHSVFFAVVKVDSRRCICKGVLWGSLSI